MDHTVSLPANHTMPAFCL